MKKPIVVIGIGELGAIFARGFLRTGHPVYPITREMHPAQEVGNIPDPALVLVAVGEDDLHAVLRSLPAAWRDRLALLQNELLPRDWQAYDLPHPTVAVVWFTKKRGIDVQATQASPVHGPHAEMIESALGSLDIPTQRVNDSGDMLLEMVYKNLHILTMNLAGLATGATLGELADEHRELTEAVANEVLDLQAWLTGTPIRRDLLLERLWVGFHRHSDLQGMGRSAPARLARAIAQADEAGLEMPRLRAIRDKTQTA
jgi:hypothetical protein